MYISVEGTAVKTWRQFPSKFLVGLIMEIMKKHNMISVVLSEI